MYVKFDDITQLVDSIKSEPLKDDEYWLILLADSHIDLLQSLVSQLNRAESRFFGAVFPGLIVDKRMHYQGAILRKVTCIAPPCCLPMPTVKQAVEHNLPEHSQLPEQGATCLTFVDFSSAGIDDLLSQLYNRFDSRCSYFGAGAGTRDLQPSATVFGNWGLEHHAALVALIDQPSKSVARHGWNRHCGPIVASRTSDNVLHELDWEDAEAAYRKALPEKLQNTPSERFYQDVTPRYPFAVEYPGAEDVVRDPISLCGNGDVRFLSDIPQGAMMYLVESTPEQLISAAREAVTAAMTDITTDSMLVCDCLSRTVALDNQFPAELRTIYDQVNQQQQGLTVEGVLALGEIASNGNRPVNFYNKTFGICCFYNE